MLQKLVRKNGSDYFLDPDAINYITNDGKVSYKDKELEGDINNVENVNITKKVKLSFGVVNLSYVLGFNEKVLVFTNGETLNINVDDAKKLSNRFSNQTITVSGLNCLKENVYSVDVENHKVNDSITIINGGDGGDDVIVIPDDAIYIDNTLVDGAYNAPDTYSYEHSNSYYGIQYLPMYESFSLVPNLQTISDKTFVYENSKEYDMPLEIASPWNIDESKPFEINYNFILLKGNAVVLTGNNAGDGTETVTIEPNKMYNIRIYILERNKPLTVELTEIK